MASPIRQFTITVPLEELTRKEDIVFRSLCRDLDLPGFRRGNVPHDLARQHIDPERVFSETVNRLVSERSSQALDHMAEEFIGEPKIEILKVARGNPLEFRITVEVLPDVPLEGWQKLRIPLKPKNVEEEEIDQSLVRLQQSRTKLRAVLRPAQRGDVLELDLSTKVDGMSIVEGSSKKQQILVGGEGFMPGFQEVLDGMRAGDHKTAILTFPRDWPVRHLAGKEGEFAIAAHNVYERIIPELNDDFARSLGRFTTLEELRASIRDGIVHERHESERRRVRTDAIDQLGERIETAAIPEILVTQEIARMQDEFRSSVEDSGIPFEEYLERMGKKSEEFLKDFREGAIRRVKAALVLRRLAALENIQVSPDEVRTRMQELSRSFTHSGDANPRIDSEELRQYTENSLRNERTMELLERTVADLEK